MRQMDMDNEENVLAGSKRKKTDFKFLVFMFIFMCIVLVFIVYCATSANLDRIFNGYDNCGNICGRITDKGSDGSCKGANYIEEKYLYIQGGHFSMFTPPHVHRECVKSCPENTKSFLNRCIQPKVEVSNINIEYSSESGLNRTTSIDLVSGIGSFLTQFGEDLHTCAWELVAIVCISFALSIITALLLRYFPTVVIWSIMIGVALLFVALTICCWIVYAEVARNGNDNRGNTIIMPISVTVATFVVCLLIYVARKRIKLVIQLFKEAGKALNSMPLLYFQPVVTLIFITISYALFGFFVVVIESSGYLEKFNSTQINDFFYEKNIAMILTRSLNILAIIWFTLFLTHCQSFVIGGAVAKWFFTRDKDNLDSPIYTSHVILIKHHLGTVAVGSFIIMIVAIIREMIRFIERGLKSSNNICLKLVGCCLSCLCNSIQECIKYLTRNAYIVCAMHGTSFCNSGYKAFKLITSNLLNVATINSVGDFVLALFKALIVVSSILLGALILKNKEGMHSLVAPLVMAGICSYIIADCFVSVFEMAIDTIFICFCEDCAYNDGISRPYFMSKGLMEFVENSKKVMKIKDEQDEQPVRVRNNGA